MHKLLSLVLCAFILWTYNSDIGIWEAKGHFEHQESCEAARRAERDATVTQFARNFPAHLCQEQPEKCESAKDFSRLVQRRLHDEPDAFLSKFRCLPQGTAPAKN